MELHGVSGMAWVRRTAYSLDVDRSAARGAREGARRSGANGSPRGVDADGIADDAPDGDVALYARVARAIEYVATRRDEQPSLEDIAASAGLSPFHFQRVFARWVGVSPKKFLQYLTLEHARAALSASAPVLDAAFASGVSGPGRLHDLFVAHAAMTPGEVRRQGAGLAVRYGFAPSPFGECLAAQTERGLCALAFIAPGGREAALAELTARFARATLVADDPGAAALCAQVFHPRPGPTRAEPLRVFLQGTRFQLQVWEALLRVPPGAVLSYEALAERVGRPGAVRAVAGAVAANPVAYVIPCHRVIRKTGAVSGYRWGGAERKLALLGWEAAEHARATAR